MKFLSVQTVNVCSQILANKISEYMSQDLKVLWLVSGGSNIDITVGTAEILKLKFKDKIKKNLVIMLTDERYGPAGHCDSNWAQYIGKGLDFSIFKEAVPVLINKNIEETINHFSERYLTFKEWADITIGQFGIGSDGHIAGVLPQTIGTLSTDTVCGYSTDSFQRITLTISEIKNISVVYTFVLGQSKNSVIKKLMGECISVEEMPAQILKFIPESYLFYDQI